LDNLRVLLKKLVETPGPAGFEDRVRDILVEELREHVDSTEVDPLGNVVFVKEGKEGSPRIMIDAHMDEVGLMVRYVDQKGFVYFDKHGWVDDRILLSQWVALHTKKGPVKGVIGTRGFHVLTPAEKERVISSKDMWIDIGAKTREDAARLGVRVGDPITFDRGYEELGGGEYVAAKALDDRLGCLAMIQTMKELDGSDLDVSVYAVGTVQEEIIARGTKVAAFKVDPDMAFVIDTAPGDDPATSEKDVPTKIGLGPIFRLMDIHPTSLLGVVTSPILKEFLIDVAEENAVPYQLDIFANTASDASTLHLVKGGIPTATIGIPRRYSHSPAEVACIRDLENTIKLMVVALKRIDKVILLRLQRKIR